MDRNQRGILHAALAASLFGGTTPAIEYFGRGAGPLAIAALIYLGSLSFVLVPDGEKKPSIAKADAPRVLVVGILGAALAPAALASGLQHAGATSAALMLNLEAVFTVILARLMYREVIGSRMMAAVALIVIGGLLLPLRTGHPDLRGGLGLALVALATLAWSADNTLSRPLAARRATSVVGWKSIVGVVLTTTLALVIGDPWPAPMKAAGLVLCGLVGYGLSLKLYVLAQRELGAARTGSVFGFAPLVGAAVAFALGDREGAIVIALAGTFLCAGVGLLATERKPEAESAA